MGGPLRLLTLLLLLSLASGLVPESWAYDENSRRYATSRSPYWDVGRRDLELSQLCRLGQFNQRRIAALYITYIGEVGRGLTGVATQGFNLRDPQQLAAPDATYHFYADGTSQCQVFVAP